MLFISENDAIMGGKLFGRGNMMNTNVLPRAVILDLDGTLLRSDKTVSERTLAVLEECKKKGMVIVVATARFWFKAEPFLNIIRPDYALLADGTMIFHDGELIHGFPMDINTSKGLINEFMSMEDGHDFVVGTGKLLLCSAKGVDEPWRQTYDFSAGFHKPAYKIASVMNSYEEAKKLADKFSCRLYSYRGEDLYASAEIFPVRSAAYPKEKPLPGKVDTGKPPFPQVYRRMPDCSQPIAEVFSLLLQHRIPMAAEPLRLHTLFLQPISVL